MSGALLDTGCRCERPRWNRERCRGCGGLRQPYKTPTGGRWGYCLSCGKWFFLKRHVFGGGFCRGCRS